MSCDCPHAERDAYTVRVSGPGGHVRFEGDHPSYGAAEIDARDRAERASPLMRFRVHRGTSRQPRAGVGPVFRGSR